VILEGKKLVITGVLTKDSIAATIAEQAVEAGAEIVLTSFGRAFRLTQRVARGLPGNPDVLELDITDAAHHTALAAALEERWGRVDGVVHAIGFAPEACLGQPDGVLSAGWDDVAVALQISTYSLKSLAVTLLPLMPPGSSLVALDFDSRQVWPAYDWMGVAKAALEATSRYLARDLGSRGVRVNLVSAGPLRTMAARSIPGFSDLEDEWHRRAPLGWDVRDPTPTAKAVVALLSDWFPATTGEIVHVDGGAHAIALASGSSPGKPDDVAVIDEGGVTSVNDPADAPDAADSADSADSAEEGASA
jgi:meromycolic acid enoyl-[acyl-carrier protein] reductase